MSSDSNDLPNAVTKRDILFGTKKLDPTELARLGRSFADAGWLSDAVDFFGRAKDKAALESIQSRAVADGDALLLLKVLRSLGRFETLESQDRASLEACALKAEDSGKTRYAIRAWEKLERQDQVERLRGLIAQDGDVQLEAEAKVFIPETTVEDGDGQIS